MAINQAGMQKLLRSLVATNSMSDHHHHVHQDFDLDHFCGDGAFQLLEYQTNVRRRRFDSLGKLTPARRAGVPTAYEGWVTGGAPAW